MNFSPTRFTVTGLVLPALLLPVLADPAPQSQISFTSGSSNTWNADFIGAEHRVYTIQWSLDLVNWQYFPFVDFGEGLHSWGFTSSSDKFFIRLRYLDDPEIESLGEAMQTSYDGTGLPLEWKVKNGLDPFNGTGANGPTGDLDGDGIANQHDARPNDDATGAVSITINTPANGTTIP